MTQTQAAALNDAAVLDCYLGLIHARLRSLGNARRLLELTKRDQPAIAARTSGWKSATAKNS